MTPEDIQKRAPKAWEAYQLCAHGRRKQADVGVLLGVSENTVSTHVRRVRAWLAEDQAPKVSRLDSTEMNRAGGARCRCGLLLPCGSCLPTIDMVASSRRGTATGEF